MYDGDTQDTITNRTIEYSIITRILKIHASVIFSVREVAVRPPVLQRVPYSENTESTFI
jgi:hypothetical protein